MHDHECTEGCDHRAPAPTLDEVIRMIGLSSLYCSRGSLELEILDAWEESPPPKKKAARKAAVVERQEEYWTILEAFNGAVPNGAAALSVPFCRAMREVLGGWAEEDFDLMESQQESLGLLLWAVGAIDAMPPLRPGVEAEVTAEAIRRINAGEMTPRMRAEEVLRRVSAELHLILQRADETLCVYREQVRAGSHARPEADILAEARAEVLARAAELDMPVQDGDIVVEGSEYGALAGDEAEDVALNAMSRARAVRWLLGEGPGPS
ncbi:MAG: hypothetical protein IT439_05110 [Phycisphaerales bacterium]|nr:hypothetical protein [Phycisphaerales bacterium]